MSWTDMQKKKIHVNDLIIFSLQMTISAWKFLHHKRLFPSKTHGNYICVSYELSFWIRFKSVRRNYSMSESSVHTNIMFTLITDMYNFMDSRYLNE